MNTKKKLWGRVGNVSKAMKSMGKGLSDRLGDEKNAEVDQSQPEAASPPNQKPSPPKDDNGMELLMEQLSAMSQRLANVRMEQADIQDQKRKAIAEKDEMAKQVEELQAQLLASQEEVKAKQDALDQVKDQVVFQKVEEGAMELKRFQTENKDLQVQLSEAKKEKEELTQQLKTSANSLETLTQSYVAAKQRSAELSTQLEQSRASNEAQAMQLDAAKQAIKDLKSQRQQQESTHRTMLSATKLEHQRQQQVLETTYSNQLQDAMFAMNKEKSAKNSKDKKLNSIKKELKKLLGERDIYKEQHKHLTTEHFRLSQELERKNLSLQDALQALHLSQDFGGVDPNDEHPNRKGNTIDAKAVISDAAASVVDVASEAASISSQTISSAGGAVKNIGVGLRDRLGKKSDRKSVTKPDKKSRFRGFGTAFRRSKPKSESNPDAESEPSRSSNNEPEEPDS